MRVFRSCVECGAIEVVVCLLYFNISRNNGAIYVEMALAIYEFWKES